jgi:rRNA maturation endonuclease Nob1
MEMIKLAVMPLQEAKNFQDQLKEKGVTIRLEHNEKTCTRGCTVTVEVLGREQDLPIVAEVYQNNFAKLLNGHEVNLDIINSVFDPSKETAICPACGTSFATSSTECPECGLVLG